MAKAYKANPPSALPPTHPGALLREEVLPAAELSVTAAASLVHELARIEPVAA